MTFTDILDHPFLKIPRNWRNLGYKSYMECVEKEGQKYIDLVNEIDDFELEDDKYLGPLTKRVLYDTVCTFYAVIIRVLETYLKEGDPHKAYKLFDDTFGIKDKIIKDPRQLVFFLDYRKLYQYSYRLRYAKNPTTYDMFHVPFEMREKVHSYRYSIPGFPTLYVSNSIFLAFQEMNCSDYDGLYVVKIGQRSLQDRNSLLDMTNRPLFDDNYYKFKYLARWPLIMACSIKVGFPSEPFRPEYIIPQITLQWVKNNINSGGRKILGVCYPSSKIDESIDGYRGEFYNIAIPIQLPSEKGHCEILKAKFCLTEPLSFRQGLSKDFISPLQSEVKGINLNGVQVNYIDTDFAKIEELLSQEPYNAWRLTDGTEL